MQDHSTVISDNSQSVYYKEYEARKNMVFPRELDAKIRSGIDTGRNKLTKSSAQKTIVRGISFHTLPNGRPSDNHNIENNRNESNRPLLIQKSQSHLLTLNNNPHTAVTSQTPKKLSDQISTLTQENTRLGNEKARISQNYENQTIQLRNTVMRLTASQTKLKDLQSKIASLSSSSKLRQEQANEYKISHQKVVSQVNLYKNKLQQAQTEILRLTNLVNQLRRELNEKEFYFQSQINILRIKTQEFESYSIKEKEKYSRAQFTIQNLQRSLQQARNLAQSKGETQSRSLMQEITRLENERERISQNYENQTIQLRNTVMRLTASQTKLKDLQSKIASLSSSSKLRQEQANEYKISHQKVVSQVNLYKNKLQQAQTEILRLTNLVNQLRRELNEKEFYFQSQINILRIKTQEFESYSIKEKEKYSRAQFTIQNLQRSLQQARNLAQSKGETQSRSLMQEITRLENERERISQNYENQTIQLRNTVMRLTASQTKLKDLQSKIASLSSSSKLRQEQANEYKISHQKVVSQVNLYKNKLQQAQTEILRLTNLVNQLRRELNEKEFYFQSQINILRIKTQEFESYSIKEKEKYSRAQFTIQNLQRSLQQARNLAQSKGETQSRSLMQEITRLENERERISQNYENQTIQLRNTVMRLTASQTKLKDLQSKIASLSSSSKLRQEQANEYKISHQKVVSQVNLYKNKLQQAQTEILRLTNLVNQLRRELNEKEFYFQSQINILRIKTQEFESYSIKEKEKYSRAQFTIQNLQRSLQQARNLAQSKGETQSRSLMQEITRLENERERISQNYENQAIELRNTVMRLTESQTKLRDVQSKIVSSSKLRQEQANEYKISHQKVVSQVSFFKNKLQQAQAYISHLEETKTIEQPNVLNQEYLKETSNLHQTIYNLEAIINDLQKQKQSVSLQLQKAEVNYKNIQQLLKSAAENLNIQQQKSLKLKKEKDQIQQRLNSEISNITKVFFQKQQVLQSQLSSVKIQIQSTETTIQNLQRSLQQARNLAQSKGETQSRSLMQEITRLENERERISQNYENQAIELRNTVMRLTESQTKLRDVQSKIVSSSKLRQEQANEYKISHQKVVSQVSFFKNKLQQAQAYISHLEETKTIEQPNVLNQEYLKETSNLHQTIYNLEAIINDLQKQKQSVSLQLQKAEVNYKNIQQLLKSAAENLNIQQQKSLKLKKEKDQIQQRLNSEISNITKVFFQKQQVLQSQLSSVKIQIQSTETTIQNLQRSLQQARNLAQSKGETQSRSLMQEITRLENERERISQNYENQAIELRNTVMRLTESQTKLRDVQSKIVSSSKLRQEQANEYKISHQKVVSQVSFFKNKLQQAQAYISHLEETKTIEQPNVLNQEYLKETSNLHQTIYNLEAIINDLQKQKQSVSLQLQKAEVNYKNIQQLLKSAAENLNIQQQKSLKLKKEKDQIQQRLNSEISNITKVFFQKQQVLQSQLSSVKIQIQSTETTIQNLQRSLQQARNLAQSKGETQSRSLMQEITRLENERERISQNYENQAIELRNTVMRLTESQTKLRDVQSKIVSSSKLRQEQANEYKISHQKVVSQVSFFKNKLQQAQAYISHLEETKTIEQPNVLNQEYLKETSNLHQTIYNLEAIINDLQKQKQSVSLQLQKAEVNYKNIQQLLKSAAENLNIQQQKSLKLKKEKDQIQQRLNSEISNITKVFFQKQQVLQSQLSSVKIQIQSTETTIQNLQRSLQQARNLAQSKGETQSRSLMQEITRLENERERISQNYENQAIELRNTVMRLTESQTKLRDVQSKIVSSSKLRQEQANEYKISHQKVVSQVSFFKNKLQQAQAYISHLEETKTIEQPNVLNQEYLKETSNLHQTIYNLEAIINDLQKQKQSVSLQLQKAEVNYKNIQQLLKSAAENLNIQQQKSLKLKKEKDQIQQRLNSEISNITKVFFQKQQVLQSQLSSVKIQIQSTETTIQNLQRSLQQARNLAQSKGETQSRSLMQEITRLENERERISQNYENQAIELRNTVMRLTESQTKLRDVQSKIVSSSKLRQEQANEYKISHQKVVSQVSFFKNKLQQAQAYISHLEETKTIEQPNVLNQEYLKETSNLHQTIYNLEAIINDLQKQKQSVSLQLQKAEVNYKNIQQLLKSAAENLNIQQQKSLKLKKEKDQIQLKIISSESLLSSNIQAIQALQSKHYKTQEQLINKTQIYNQTVSSLKKQLNSLKQQLNSSNIDSQTQIKVFNENKEILKQQPVDPLKKIQEERQFFKSKLLQAESYIEVLQLQKKQIQKNVSETVVSKMHKHEEEIQSLSKQLVFVRQEKVALKSAMNELYKSNENLNENLRVAAIHGTTNEDFVRMSYQVNQLKKELNEKEILMQQQINSLKRRKEELESYNLIEKGKYSRAESTIKNLEKSLHESKTLTDYYQSKHAESQIYISNLELLTKAKQQVLSSLESHAQLKQKATSLEVQNEKLQLQIRQSKDSLASLETKFKQSINDNGFFKNKLLSAETFIVQLQKQAKERQNQQSSQLTELKQQNIKLNQKLSTIRIQVQQPNQKQMPYQVSFLKQKLYEAQSYIIELQRQNETLTQQSVDKQVTINELQQNITTLNEQIVEAQLLNMQLQTSKAEQTDKVSGQVNDPLMRKISQLQSSLKSEVAKKQKKIQDLTAEVNSLQNSIKAGQSQKQALEAKYQEIIVKQTQETNSLKENIKNKDTSISGFIEKISQDQKYLKKGKFFQQKLLEAQSYITELERQNNDLNNNCDSLKIQVQQLEAESISWQQKFNQSENQRLILATQINSLKEQHEPVVSSIQQVSAPSNAKDNELISSLQERIRQIQQSSNEHRLQTQVEIDLLTKKLQQAKRCLALAENSIKAHENEIAKLRDELITSQVTKMNLTKSMTLKQEQIASIQPILSSLQQANKQIALLQNENSKHYNHTQNLLEQITRITEENNILTEQLFQLAPHTIDLKDSSELQKLRKSNEERSPRIQELKNQISTLNQELISLKSKVGEHHQFITFEKVPETQDVTILRAENQKLKTKVLYLEAVQKQYQQFKATVIENQQAQKQLEQVEKQLQQQGEQKIKNLQSSKLKDSGLKNKQLEESLEQAQKQLENEMKEDITPQSKELQKEISNLKALLEQKEQQNKIIKSEQLVQEEAIRNQEQTIKFIKQQLTAIQSKEQQISEHFVQTQSQNLQLHTQLESLNALIIQKEQKEQIASNQITKLKHQFNQRSQQLQNNQDLITKLKSDIANQTLLIQQLQLSLRQTSSAFQAQSVEQQSLISQLTKQLTNKEVTISQTSTHFEAQIKHLQDNITHLNQEITNKEAAIQSFSTMLSPEKIQEEITSPIKIHMQEKAIIEPEQYDRLKSQLEQIREHLVLAECEISTLQGSLSEISQQNVILKEKLNQYESQLKQQTDTYTRLELTKSQNQEQLLKKQQMLEQNLYEANIKISEQSLQNESKEEKLGSSIKKLISLTSNQQGGSDPTEVLQQLQEFPYLNELIKSIIYKLQLSSALELQKSLKIQENKQEIQENKQEIQQLQNINNELMEQLNRFKVSLTLLKEQNELLRKTNQQIQQQLLRKFEERRSEAEQKSLHLLSAEQKIRQLTDYIQTQRVNEQENVQPTSQEQKLLNQIMLYQSHNNQLTEQLNQLTSSNQNLKSQLKQFQELIDVLNQSHQENKQLRQKLSESEKLRVKEAGDTSSMGTKSLLRLEFLQVCLERTDEIQREVRYLQNQIEQLGTKQKRVLATSQEGKGDDSQLVQRLQQLEQRLLKNSSNIREHQQKSDGQLYGLLKELLEDEQISQGSKHRIQDYLTQLEQQILRQHEQHQAEVAILRQQISRKQKSHQLPYSDRSRQDLLRQINNLNSAIQIYHQESMRRKKVYRRTLDSLLQDIYQLHQQLQEQGTAELVRKIQEALQKEEQEDLQFEGDDFIIPGGTGHIQVLESKQRQYRGLNVLTESVGQIQQNGEPIAIQTEVDTKPFLNFLLSAQDLDKEDLKLLKRKVAQLRGREIEQNLLVLKTKQRKLEQVLGLGSKQGSGQQIQNIIVTLANNYSRDEISQIFGSEDNDQLLNKLNEALNLEESFYRGQNSSTMMHEIQEKKRKYYETPTKLSEQVFKHLLLLLSAKKDEQFYDLIDSLFRNMYEIEIEFENALIKKNQIYRTHNERMNQIFNRSSSDSEDYLVEIERENQHERISAEKGEGPHSERKPKSQEQEISSKPQ